MKTIHAAAADATRTFSGCWWHEIRVQPQTKLINFWSIIKKNITHYKSLRISPKSARRRKKKKIPFQLLPQDMLCHPSSSVACNSWSLARCCERNICNWPDGAVSSPMVAGAPNSRDFPSSKIWSTNNLEGPSRSRIKIIPQLFYFFGNSIHSFIHSREREYAALAYRWHFARHSSAPESHHHDAWRRLRLH